MQYLNFRKNRCVASQSLIGQQFGVQISNQKARNSPSEVNVIEFYQFWENFVFYHAPLQPSVKINGILYLKKELSILENTSYTCFHTSGVFTSWFGLKSESEWPKSSKVWKGAKGFRTRIFTEKNKNNDEKIVWALNEGMWIKIRLLLKKHFSILWYTYFRLINLHQKHNFFHRDFENFSSKPIMSAFSSNNFGYIG